MHKHPLNLAFRFLLELTALIAMGIWGWQLSDLFIRFLLVWGIPVLAAVLWGVFAVPGDPSRSGKAPIPVHGAIRLILELGFFAFATWIFYRLNHRLLSMVMGGAVVFHYLISWERVLWLIRQKSPENKNL
ncbi:YrdB family protein [Draconibacterium sp.]|nr:YrdB family protein [Draconibacterium sp.]